MADYPSSIYEPRTKNNKSGVVYTPANDTQLYAEDVSKLDAEVVALEQNLQDKRDRLVQIIAVAPDTVVPDGDGLFTFIVPEGLDGYDIVSAHAGFNSPDSTGDLTFDIYNVTNASSIFDGTDIIQIDHGDKVSYDSANQPVLDSEEVAVATGDELRIDADSNNDDAEGLQIFLIFRKPIT